MTHTHTHIYQKIQQYKNISVVNIGTELDTDHKIVLNRLHKACHKKKLDVGVLRELSA